MSTKLNLFTPENFDLNKVEVGDVYVNVRDYPDLCDSYICDAEYDGQEMSEDEIEWTEENHPDWAYEIFLARML